MYLAEAVDAIREQLVQHRLSGRKTLWATLLAVIRSLLSQLDDATIISLWRQTETGMGDETEDECLYPDSARMDLEMELLQEITDLAWKEAEDAP
jgi:hypothetical protein